MDRIPVTPVIEPLIISITEIQPESTEGSPGRFTGEWSSPPLAINLVDRQPLASPTSSVTPTADGIVVDRQPEPLSKVILDGRNDNVCSPVGFTPSSPLFVTETIAISSTENVKVERPEAVVVVEEAEEKELVEEKVILVQPPATLHDEIQKLQMSVEKSFSATEETACIEDDHNVNKPKTLLEQAEAALGDLDVSRSHIDNDGDDCVVFGTEGLSTTTTATTTTTVTSTNSTSSSQQQHQITYDGCDDDEDSVIQRIRNHDKKIVEQIRKENEHNPEWLKGLY